MNFRSPEGVQHLIRPGTESWESDVYVEKEGKVGNVTLVNFHHTVTYKPFTGSSWLEDVKDKVHCLFLSNVSVL